jgi:hypothetical protein
MRPASRTTCSRWSFRRWRRVRRSGRSDGDGAATERDGFGALRCGGTCRRCRRRARALPCGKPPWRFSADCAAQGGGRASGREGAGLREWWPRHGPTRSIPACRRGAGDGGNGGAGKKGRLGAAGGVPVRSWDRFVRRDQALDGLPVPGPTDLNHPPARRLPRSPLSQCFCGHGPVDCSHGVDGVQRFVC